VADPRWAVVENGVVTATITASNAFVTTHEPGAIEIDGILPEPGMRWTFAAGVFSPPAPPSGGPANSVFSRIQFRLLFTTAELQAIDGYLSAGLTAGQNKAIATGLINFAQSDLIDLTATYVSNAVTFLGTVGLITPARATAILATRT
jgi:hypothetical protein